MDENVKCPKCGSSDVTFRRKRRVFICDDCDHQFEPAAAPDEAPAGERRPRLFLSYGRRDAAELADKLCEDLTRHEYDVWRDTREIRGVDADWQREIVDGLRSSQVVVALLSPHAVRVSADPGNPDDLDSVCLDELSFARFAQPPTPILPVMASPCEPPFCVFRLNYVDMCSSRESDDAYQAGLTQLLDELAAARRGEVRYRSWEHDLRPWDFAAFLHEKRRDFCGREWLFDELDAWRQATAEPALLLTGDPGVGKSAIVAELVHQNPGGQVLAYHCCQADTHETLQPGRFVRSLAAMIASKLPAYAACLADPAVKQALSVAACDGDPASAFEEGILNALQALPAPTEGVRYILVDALDESLLAESGPSSRSIVDVLSSRLNRLPPWLRIVATTRKEPRVLDRLRGLRARELDAQDPRNLDDIERYVARRLATPNLAERVTQSGKSDQEIQSILRDKGEGNFLYVQQALEGIERGIHDPDRLAELPPGLYGLYLSFFERHFPDEASYAPMRALLEVVVAAREPLTEDRIARASGLNSEDELPRLLRRVAAYLPRREGRYAVYHKSLADWLTSEDQRGALHSVSASRGHQRMADACWHEYQQGAAAMSNYALRYLPMHLTAAQRWEEVEGMLTDLAFLEAKVAAGLTFDLTGDFGRAIEALPLDRPMRRILSLLDEAIRRDIHFIARHAEDYPQGLFQCLWNTGWWYDHPAAARHYDPPEGGWPSVGPPWQRSGPKLCDLLDRWRTERQALALQEGRGHSVGSQSGGSELLQPWLRSSRPPALPLGSAQIAQLTGHTGNVTSVAFSPDDRRIASVSRDNTVRVWDAASGECLEVIEGTADAGAIAAGPASCAYRLIGRDLETVVESATTGEPIAWLPIVFTRITTHPRGRKWVGRYLNHFHIITLERGDVESREHD